LKIEELWMSLPAVVVILFRRSYSGYEGRIGYYGGVVSLRHLLLGLF